MIELSREIAGAAIAGLLVAMTLQLVVTLQLGPRGTLSLPSVWQRIAVWLGSSAVCAAVTWVLWLEADPPPRLGWSIAWGLVSPIAAAALTFVAGKRWPGLVQSVSRQVAPKSQDGRISIVALVLLVGLIGLVMMLWPLIRLIWLMATEGVGH